MVPPSVRYDEDAGQVVGLRNETVTPCFLTTPMGAANRSHRRLERPEGVESRCSSALNGKNESAGETWPRGDCPGRVWQHGLYFLILITTVRTRLLLRKTTRLQWRWRTRLCIEHTW